MLKIYYLFLPDCFQNGLKIQRRYVESCLKKCLQQSAGWQVIFTTASLAENHTKKIVLHRVAKPY